MGVVLIVDDDALVRRCVERLVASTGHAAITASGVDEALGCLADRAVDLVLTDLQMRGESGLSLVRTVRDRWPAIPVVLMSCALDEQVREVALSYGAAAAIDKLSGADWVLSSLGGVLAAAAATTTAGASSQGSRSDGPAVDVTPRVLIVEDDEDIRDALEAVVSREGFEAVSVSHGLEALRYLRASDRLPNLIILDLMMPVMDGWEFLRRRDERSRAVPVVVITAGRTDGLPPDVRCLSKPISMELLLDELRPCWNAGDRR